MGAKSRKETPIPTAAINSNSMRRLPPFSIGIGKSVRRSLTKTNPPN